MCVRVCVCVREREREREREVRQLNGNWVVVHGYPVGRQPELRISTFTASAFKHKVLDGTLEALIDNIESDEKQIQYTW